MLYQSYESAAYLYSYAYLRIIYVSSRPGTKYIRCFWIIYILYVLQPEHLSITLFFSGRTFSYRFRHLRHSLLTYRCISSCSLLIGSLPHLLVFFVIGISSKSIDTLPLLTLCLLFAAFLCYISDRTLDYIGCRIDNSRICLFIYLRVLFHTRTYVLIITASRLSP